LKFLNETSVKDLKEKKMTQKTKPFIFIEKHRLFTIRKVFLST